MLGLELGFRIRVRVRVRDVLKAIAGVELWRLSPDNHLIYKRKYNHYLFVLILIRCILVYSSIVIVIIITIIIIIDSIKVEY